MQTSIDLYSSFYRRIRDIEYTRTNVTRVYDKGHLVRRDLALAYEGLFLRCVCQFEALIESLFVGLLVNGVKHPRPVNCRLVFPNQAVAKRIVTQAKYVDWLPYDRLVELSGIYYAESGNPFRGCDTRYIAGIQQACWIRNYIAHRSEHARKSFEKNVVGATALPGRRGDLLTYLLFPHSASANKYEYHIGELVQAARWFCH